MSLTTLERTLLRGFKRPLSWRVLRGGGGVGGGPMWLVVRFDVSGRAVIESAALAVAVTHALDREKVSSSRMGGSATFILLLAASAVLGFESSIGFSPVARPTLEGLALWSGNFRGRERLDLDDELEVPVWDSNSLTKVLVAWMGVTSVR